MKMPSPPRKSTCLSVNKKLHGVNRRKLGGRANELFELESVSFHAHGIESKLLIQVKVGYASFYPDAVEAGTFWNKVADAATLAFRRLIDEGLDGPGEGRVHKTHRSFPGHYGDVAVIGDFYEVDYIVAHLFRRTILTEAFSAGGVTVSVSTVCSSSADWSDWPSACSSSRRSPWLSVEFVD
jgi:hypothetical protein